MYLHLYLQTVVLFLFFQLCLPGVAFIGQSDDCVSFPDVTNADENKTMDRY